MNNLKIPSVEISSGTIDSYLKQLAGREKVLYDKIKQLEIDNQKMSDREKTYNEKVLQLETDSQNLKNRLNSLSIMLKRSTTSIDGRFTDNIDGTVTDNKTGLMWKKYPEGLSGSGCSPGTAEKFTWDNAVKRVQDINMRAGFAGYHDWRLPDIDELKSIIDKKSTKPSINQHTFPDTPPAYFWSSSPYADGSNFAWFVNFDNGYDALFNRIYSYYVRLVRGGK